MEDEVWKPILGYECLYEVSSEGRVRSLDRIIIYKDGRRKILKERILHNNVNDLGYYFVSLSKNGEQKKYKVHRLVAQAFLPNPNNLPCVNHKDETPSHNNVENLEWCTQKYNCNYGTCRERMISSLRNHPKKSKKVYQYTLDGQLVKIWESTAECGRHGFNYRHISSCCRQEQGHITHKGFRWSYMPL